MIYKNVELFNVEEVEEYDGGVILQRYPAGARRDMKNRAGWMASASMGNEIRFVCEGQGFYLTVGAGAGDVTIYLMRGEYTQESYVIKAGEKKVLRFENNDIFRNVRSEEIEKFNTRFSHKVWRFYLHSEGYTVFYDCRGFGGDVRPPKPEEVPKTKMLAYGSSITHWCWAMDSRNSFIQYVARRLDMDVLNKGMAGACRLEDSTMEYLIGTDDWDIAFLELGVNVLSSYSVEEFQKRAEYLVSGLCKKNPEKYVFLTCSFYNSTYFSKNPEAVEKLFAYEKVLSDIKEKYNLSKLIYIDGREIMDNASYLSFDLVHPSDYGNVRMGENLAGIIKKYI